MAVCAAAGRRELETVLAELGDVPVAHDMRMPESGLVMLRGRMGGDGAAFNLGEATVTRAAIRLDSGPAGFAYHLGRDAAKARLAAIVDAVWQIPERRPEVERALGRVQGRIAREEERRARETAATRVDFFTLVRGDA